LSITNARNSDILRYGKVWPPAPWKIQVSSENSSKKHVLPKKAGAAETRRPWLNGCTLLLSGILLFQVQFIAAKHMLPWFGGSAAVWTTAMLLFQLLLLGGYVYSHLVSTRLRSSAQVTVHWILLLSAAGQIAIGSCFWPTALTPGREWAGVDPAQPVRSVILVLLASVGLPFFALSATAPLVQKWAASSGEGARAYRLYSISNLGSLVGLLSYPFWIEAALGVQSQAKLWCVSFGGFVLLCGACGWKFRAGHSEPQAAEGKVGQAGFIAPADFGMWFALAACASTLLLATTNVLCQEVTSMPLLWALPLALYLATFILSFDHPRWYRRGLVHPLYAIFLLLTALALEAGNFRVQVILLPATLFLTCLVCHGELVRRKPDAARLTAFYLAISGGGAAGGVFAAIVAPQVFSSFAELQLALGGSAILLLAALWRDKTSWFHESEPWMPAAIAAAGLAAAFVGAMFIDGVAAAAGRLYYFWVVGAMGVTASLGLWLARDLKRGPERGAWFVQASSAGLAILSVFALYQSTRPETGVFLRVRNFYGAIRVSHGPGGTTKLEHGQTTHGYQLPPPDDRLPTTYYGPNSTIGIVLRNHPKHTERLGGLRVGVVGLGAGTVAAYGLPGDYFCFYELNPAVVSIAIGPRAAFSFLRDSAAKIDVLTGDARLLMESQAARGELQSFDVLALDAFNGDAIPVHLLTKEAFATYFRHLAPGGIIAVHMSSRHVNLEPVLHAIVEEFPVEARATFTIERAPFKSSLWMLFSAVHEMLEIPGLDQIQQAQPSNDPPLLWTDDRSSILSLLRF
jgi:hypothetical protein